MSGKVAGRRDSPLTVELYRTVDGSEFATGLTALTANVAPDGDFVFPRVTPGRYVVRVVAFPKLQFTDDTTVVYQMASYSTGGSVPVALSFVIPLYKSADTIAGVVRDIEALKIDGGHEIILVNDGSGDRTGEVCRDLVRTARIPITYIEHARNYGEHNAVLTGWRHAPAPTS